MEIDRVKKIGRTAEGLSRAAWRRRKRGLFGEEFVDEPARLCIVYCTINRHNIPKFHSSFMSLRFEVEQKLCQTRFLETIGLPHGCFRAINARFRPFFCF